MSSFSKEVAKDLIELIDSIVANQDKTYSKRLHKEIAYLAKRYSRFLKTTSSKKSIKTINDIVYNSVISHLKNLKIEEVIARDKERLSGIIIISSFDMGWLVEEQKTVAFQSFQPVLLGNMYVYNRLGDKYIVEGVYEGDLNYTRSYRTGGYNIVGRSGEKALLGTLKTSDKSVTDLPIDINLKYKLGPAVTGENLWVLTNEKYGYFIGNTYYEGVTTDSTKADFSIDCSAYFYTYSLSYYISGLEDWVTTIRERQKEIIATKPSKVLKYGKYRLIRLTRMVAYSIEVHANEPGGIGVPGFYNELAIHDLLVVDTEENTITKYGPTHANWINKLEPDNLHVGYLDFKIDYETQKLLILRTSDVVQTNTIDVSHYDYDRAFVGQEPPDYPVRDATAVIAPPILLDTYPEEVYSVSNFYLIRASISDSIISEETTLHTQAGRITTLEGETVEGLVTNILFCQHPVSYRLYLNIHKWGYKQGTSEYSPRDRHPYYVYALYGVGFWSIYGITEATTYDTVVSSAGLDRRVNYDGAVYGTCYDRDKASVINDLEFYATMALEEFWPQFLGTSLYSDYTDFYSPTIGSNFSGVMGCASPNNFYAGPYDSNTGAMTYTASQLAGPNQNNFFVISNYNEITPKFIWHADKLSIYSEWVTVDAEYTWTDEHHLGYFSIMYGFDVGPYITTISGYSVPLCILNDFLDGVTGESETTSNVGSIVLSSGDDPGIYTAKVANNNISMDIISESEFIILTCRTEHKEYLNGDMTTAAASTFEYYNWLTYVRLINSYPIVVTYELASAAQNIATVLHKTAAIEREGLLEVYFASL